ncbi:unnamed protein product [Anisakis simplex]|uniref:Flocculation protein FLO11 n=1 Tax=Anisakis simplex TaxID=6269 RepID=A0A0M3JY67_ANISI|nr:unnamed protein product [Anisakis simplex]
MDSSNLTVTTSTTPLLVSSSPPSTPASVSTSTTTAESPAAKEQTHYYKKILKHRRKYQFDKKLGKYVHVRRKPTTMQPPYQTDSATSVRWTDRVSAEEIITPNKSSVSYEALAPQLTLNHILINARDSSSSVEASDVERQSTLDSTDNMKRPFYEDEEENRVENDVLYDTASPRLSATTVSTTLQPQSEPSTSPHPISSDDDSSGEFMDVVIDSAVIDDTIEFDSSEQRSTIHSTPSPTVTPLSRNTPATTVDIPYIHDPLIPPDHLTTTTKRPAVITVSTTTTYPTTTDSNADAEHITDIIPEVSIPDSTGSIGITTTPTFTTTTLTPYQSPALVTTPAITASTSTPSRSLLNHPYTSTPTVPIWTTSTSFAALTPKSSTTVSSTILVSSTSSSWTTSSTVAMPTTTRATPETTQSYFKPSIKPVPKAIPTEFPRIKSTLRPLSGPAPQQVPKMQVNLANRPILKQVPRVISKPVLEPTTTSSSRTTSTSSTSTTSTTTTTTTTTTTSTPKASRKLWPNFKPVIKPILRPVPKEYPRVVHKFDPKPALKPMPGPIAQRVPKIQPILVAKLIPKRIPAVALKPTSKPTTSSTTTAPSTTTTKPLTTTSTTPLRPKPTTRPKYLKKPLTTQAPASRLHLMSNMDSSQPRLSGFTLVTALLDIGRGQWWEYRRPLNRYYEYLNNVLELRVNLVIYVDPKTVDYVLQKRKHFKLDHVTKIIPFTLSELPLHQYMTYVEQIIDYEQRGNGWSSEWDETMKTHPEAKSAAYDIVVNSKSFFLYNASIENPFTTENFVWLDAGYGHGNRAVFPPGFRWYPHFPPNKISLIKVTPEYDQISRYTINDLYRKDWAVISGGFLGGDRDAINQFHRSYQHLILDLISQRRADDDQTALVLLIQERPALFNVVHGSWFDAFRLFN